ncbi:MAG TPA: hypothetical protein VLH10_03825, partial [Yinghuangia sp.]|nr:hypothetical protein [Yinghuangia sp.]
MPNAERAPNKFFRGHVHAARLTPSRRRANGSRTMSDYEPKDFFTDLSVVTDPYPHFDELRAR